MGSGIRHPLFRPPPPISPGQNPTPPGIRGQIPAASRLGEEIKAFVDDEERQDDAIEAKDLAKFKAQGNFRIQKRGLSVRQDFVTGFIANIARDKVRYRFSNITKAASM